MVQLEFFIGQDLFECKSIIVPSLVLSPLVGDYTTSTPGVLGSSFFYLSESQLMFSGMFEQHNKPEMQH